MNPAGFATALIIHQGLSQLELVANAGYLGVATDELLAFPKFIKIEIGCSFTPFEFKVSVLLPLNTRWNPLPSLGLEKFLKKLDTVAASEVKRRLCVPE